MLSKSRESPMKRNKLLGFVMRYGTNKEKNTKLGEGLIKMTGKREPLHTKEDYYYYYYYYYFFFFHPQYSIPEGIRNYIKSGTLDSTSSVNSQDAAAKLLRYKIELNLWMVTEMRCRRCWVFPCIPSALSHTATQFSQESQSEIVERIKSFHDYRTEARCCGQFGIFFHLLFRCHLCCSTCDCGRK